MFTKTVDGVYSFILEVPGFGKKDLEINLDGGILTVVGEISTTTGKRAVNSTVNIGKDTINKVTLENGILEIKINESPKPDKSTKINID